MFRTLILSALIACTIHPAFANTEFAFRAGVTPNASNIRLNRDNVAVNSQADQGVIAEAEVMRRADRIISYGGHISYGQHETDTIQTVSGKDVTGESLTARDLSVVAKARAHAFPASSPVDVFAGGGVGGSHSRFTVECEPNGVGCVPLKAQRWRAVYRGEAGVSVRLFDGVRAQVVGAWERHGRDSERKIVTAGIGWRF